MAVTPHERQVIAGAAAKYGINPAVLYGLWGTEAGFSENPGTSSAGAVGPFQFLPSTAKGMGVDPLNFGSAAKGAAKYLSQYKDRGTAGMLSAYNAGPAGAPQPAYVRSVLSKAKGYPGAPAVAAPKAQAATVAPQKAAQTRTEPSVGQILAPLLGQNSLLYKTGVLSLSPDVVPVNQAVQQTNATLPQADGAKQAPQSAFAKMVHEANQVAAGHYNYEWGGGHTPTFAPIHGSGHGSGPGVGYDCSGALSVILHAAGKLAQPLVAEQFMHFGQEGPGGPHAITIYASPTHTFAEINGKFFGTSSANPGGGAGWFKKAMTDGYTVRHVNLGPS